MYWHVSLCSADVIRPLAALVSSEVCDLLSKVVKPGDLWSIHTETMWYMSGSSNGVGPQLVQYSWNCINLKAMLEGQGTLNWDFVALFG